MTDSESTLSLEELLEHQGWLRGLARRLVQDEARADDVVQQALVAAWERPPRAGVGVRGWLATVARRAASNLRREEGRRAARERAAAARESIPSTDELMAEVDAQRTVVEEVSKLREPYRTTVLLRFFRDLSARAIAEHEGVPVATVETRLRRALAELAERIDRRHGGDRRSWCLALLPVAAGAKSTEAAALAGGAWIMSLSWKTIAAIAIVVVGSGLFWHGLTDDAPDPLVATAPANEADATPDVSEENVGANATDAPSRAVDRRETTGTVIEDVDAPLATLRVMDDVGTKAAGATVVLVKDGEVIADGETDEEGAVRFDAMGGAAHLIVDWDGAPPHRADVDLAPGERDVVLPRGTPVSGRVLVDGASPGEPIELFLYAHEPYPIEGLTPAIRERVGPNFGYQLRRLTDDEGSFRFSGLPAAVPLTLRWRDNHYVGEGGDDSSREALKLERARDNIIVYLRRLPTLRGRVIDREGSPLPDALIKVFILHDQGNLSTAYRADAAGRFEVPLGRYGRTERVDLRIVRSDLPGELSRTVDGDLEHGRDLGDITIAPPRKVRFRVRDTDGTPVAGARGHAGEEPRDPSAPTDEDGYGELEMAAGDPELWITRVGYDIAVIPVPTVTDDLLEVSLRAATALTVTLVDRDDRPVPRLGISFASKGHHLFTDPGGRADPPGSDDARSHDLSIGWGLGTDHATENYRSDDQGRLVLRRLVPNAPFELSIVSPLGVELHRETLTLVPGEHRDLRIIIERTPRRIGGTVVDQQGEPLDGATISVSDGTRRTSARTDAYGRFELPALYAERISLLTTRFGFAPYFENDLYLPPSGLDLALRLVPGHDVTLTLRDRAGRLLDGAEVLRRVPELEGAFGGYLGGDEQGDGRYRFEDLPSGRVDFEAHVGGRAYELTHDTSAPDPVLVVPVVHGALAVTLDEPFETLVSHRVRLEPIEDGHAMSDDDMLISAWADAIAHTLPHVEPGRYDVFLEVISEEDWETFHPVAEARDVTVRAGETTSVPLTRPQR